MTIKMTMADGTVIEGTAEELAKLQRLTDGEFEKDETEFIPEYKTEDRPAKIGERILITDKHHTETRYENGDVFEVGYVNSDGDVDTKEEDYFILRSEYEVIIDEENDVPRSKFKVGDYAKVIGETYFGDISEGTIVKIVEDVTDFEGEYRIDLIDGSDFDLAKPEALEKVELTDDEDLAFLKIGRKPGEYKVGDIAEVIESPYASPEGSLVEITKTYGYGEVKAKRYGDAMSYFYEPQHLKLIAPVEARVDINDA